MSVINKKLELTGYKDILDSQIKGNKCDANSMLFITAFVFRYFYVNYSDAVLINRRLYKNVVSTILCPPEINIYEHHASYIVSDAAAFTCIISVYYLYEGTTSKERLVVSKSNSDLYSKSNSHLMLCACMSSIKDSSTIDIDFYVKPKVGSLDIVAIEYEDLYN